MRNEYRAKRFHLQLATCHLQLCYLHLHQIAALFVALNNYQVVSQIFAIYNLAMTRKQQTNKKNRVSDESIYDRILELCGAAGSEKSVKPEAIAQSLAQFDWQPLIKRVRRAAVQLANAGYIHIIRKGKIADPDDFKGLYKVRLVPGADWQTHLEDDTINKGSGVGAGKTAVDDDETEITVNIRQ